MSDASVAGRQAQREELFNFRRHLIRPKLQQPWWLLLLPLLLRLRLLLLDAAVRCCYLSSFCNVYTHSTMFLASACSGMNSMGL